MTQITIDKSVVEQALEALRSPRFTKVSEAKEILRRAIEQAKEQELPAAVYGYCPKCGAKGVMRERRPNGNDTCANGHVYPSSEFTYRPLATNAQPTQAPLTDEQIKGIYEDCDAPTSGEFILAFARAIEAAHGIKGEA